MVIHLAAGLTPDALFSGSSTLIVGLCSILVSVALSIYDRRSQKSKRDATAIAAQKRVDELSDRMDAQREKELARISGLYEAQIVDLQSSILELHRNVKYWQRRATEKGGAVDD